MAAGGCALRCSVLRYAVSAAALREQAASLGQLGQLRVIDVLLRPSCELCTIGPHAGTKFRLLSRQLPGAVAVCLPRISGVNIGRGWPPRTQCPICQHHSASCRCVATWSADQGAKVHVSSIKSQQHEAKAAC